MPFGDTGGVQEMVAWPVPVVVALLAATGVCGAVGLLPGATVTDTGESAPVPNALVALTVKL